jgi:predicted nucleic acid-binding protein
LRRHARIALDTSVLIYFLQENPRYIELADYVMRWIERPGHSASTSIVTMTELVAKPYAVLDEESVGRMKEYLLDYPNLEWIPADMRIAVLAGHFRAAYKLKTPDALQAATAVQSGATALVTNDAIFERIPAFETLTLDRLL